MTINFVLKKAIVQILLSQSKTRWFFPTGVSVIPNDWDKELQRVSQSDIHFEAKNAVLESKYSIVYSTLMKAKFMGQEINRDLIEQALGSKKNTTKTIKEAVLKYLAQLAQKSKPITVRTQTITLSQFLEFSDKINWSGVTAIHLEEWVRFLIEKKNNNNISAHKKLSVLKTFLRWAQEQDYHAERDWLSAKASVEDTANKPWLTEDELSKFSTFDFGQLEELTHARDIFCLGCYTGLRYSDLFLLKWEHIKKGNWIDAETKSRKTYQYIDLNMMKTSSQIEIPLIGHALRIIEKYKAAGAAAPVYKMTNQAMNRAIKEAAEMAGINALWVIVRFQGKKRLESTVPKYQILSTHSARHTFITLSEQRGIPLTDIQKIVGHKTIQQTARYTRSDKNKRAQIMGKAWDD